MKPHVEFLARLGVCPGSIAWAAEFPTPRAAWFACGQSNWLLWLLRRIHIDLADGEWRLFTVGFAEDALKFIPAGNGEIRDICERTTETTRCYVLGAATDEELRAVEKTAWGAVSAARSTASAAKNAARSAAWGVASMMISP